MPGASGLCTLDKLGKVQPWKRRTYVLASKPLERKSWLFGGIFDIPQKQQRLVEIEELSAAANFWTAGDQAKQLLKEQAQATQTVRQFAQAERMVSDAHVMFELAHEAQDAASLEEAAHLVMQAEQAVDRMEFARMLSGPQDIADALVSINAGAGGVDAQDWADILRRMYLRWCERQGYKVEELDLQEGDEAGIKSTTFAVRGQWAYGYLRAENGVHRLVRISPFDSNARRHTSFASVFVYPEIDDSIEVDIREEDLEVQTMRSGGAGGQHVNKTESAVRIIHKPTGLVAKCQSERSQHKNKSMAMKMLRAMIYNQKLQEQEAKMNEVHGQKKAIEWGSQIRSYVLAPYQQVADHRTEVKIGNVHAVLDGELTELMKAYLMQQQR